MGNRESVFAVICKEVRREKDILSFVQQAANYDAENFPESSLSFWAKCFDFAEENGFSDKRIERILHLKSMGINKGMTTLQNLGASVYLRLTHALQVIDLESDNKTPPSNKTFLIPLTTTKVEFFDFINAGLFVMQPTETACIGGEKFCVIKSPDSEILNLNVYRNMVREASLELFQADPPYRELLDNLMGGFSKEVLPQLGLEVRHER